MSLYAVKNEEGKWLNVDGVNYYWREDIGELCREANAKVLALMNRGHAVEVVEKPVPIVVSEEEAEMLEKAKGSTWRPASVIASYAVSHCGESQDLHDLEGRLMRAYVNGWTVEKPKLWNVKVPHAKTLIYFKVEDPDDLGAAQCDSEGDWVEFTLAEIEHHDLQDCEKREVKQDD